LLAVLRPLLVDGLVASASSVPFVDIAPPGIDKAFGVARLCERLGIDRSEVAALGDHINDVALLRWAGRSVAMGDAHPEVLAAAAEVTATCEVDGAAVWLEALLAGRSGDGSAGRTSSVAQQRTVPSGSSAPRIRNSLVNPAMRLRPRLRAPTTVRPSRSACAVVGDLGAGAQRAHHRAEVDGQLPAGLRASGNGSTAGDDPGPHVDGEEAVGAHVGLPVEPFGGVGQVVGSIE
jgi:hypothetical protein